MISPQHMRRRLLIFWLLLIFLIFLAIASATAIILLPFSPIVHPRLITPLHMQDLHLSNFQVDQNVQPDKTHHSYKATISLKSLQSKIPLSALQGSVTDGQTRTLSDLLGRNNTPCVTATLLTDRADLDVQPSLTQEYSLEQSQITWIWNITPIHADQRTQDIPILIDVVGKTSCDTSSRILKGPYHLAKDVSLTLIAPDANLAYLNTPSPQPPLSSLRKPTSIPRAPKHNHA